MKTAELEGVALDYAVALCESRRQAADMIEFGYRWFVPSTSWTQAGPIIEREQISLKCSVFGLWEAHANNHNATRRDDVEYARQQGPTPLVAAMRCYVASKRGGTIEIPEALCKPQS